MKKITPTFNVSVPDVASIFIALLALWVAVQSLEIVKEPQLEFYLQEETGSQNTGRESYLFGVENDGIIPVTDLSAKYLTLSIKKDCAYNSYCENLDLQEQAMFAKEATVGKLEPGQETQAKIIVAYPQGGQTDEYIKVIAILANYTHNVDKRSETEEIIFLIDGYRVYTLDAANQVERLKPYVNIFWDSLNDSPFFSQKIYWRNFK